MPMSGRLLRPRATGFNPKSIAGLVGWWDASVSSSVTLNSGRVSNLADLSGSGPAMTQGTAANQPLYVTAGRNGKNTISIDDTARRLTNATTQAIGFFAIALAPTGAQSFGSLFSFSDKHGMIRSGTGDGLYFGGPPATGNMFGTSSVYRKNGSASTSLGFDWAVFSAGGTQDTRAARLQTDGVGGAAATGQFGELLLYSSDLTLTQKQAIERYLGKKWGIAVA
jgi:hypothetical protein